MTSLADTTSTLQTDDSEFVVPLDRYGFPGVSYSAKEHGQLGRSRVNAALGRTPRYEPVISMPGTVSTLEYARRLGVCECTVGRWIRTGKLKAFKADAKYRWVYRIPVDEVTA